MKILLSILLFTASVIALQSQTFNLSSTQDLAALHNGGLDYMGQTNAGASNLGDLSGLQSNLQALQQFYVANNLPTSDFPTVTEVQQIISNVRQGDIYALAISQGTSTYVASKLVELVDICVDATDIVDLETKTTQFISNLQGSANDNMSLEAAAYTAVSSANFWQDAALNQSHPFHDWAQGDEPGIWPPDGGTTAIRIKFKFAGINVDFEISNRFIGDAIGVGIGVAAGGFTAPGIAAGVGLGTLISSNFD